MEVNASKHFISRPDDIYVVGYPRSGTTWMQMICHQLKSNGAMSFDHIYDVAPFLEMCLKNGTSLEEMPSPRIVKSHLLYRTIYQYQGKYIYIIRDGRDVLISCYFLQKRYMNPNEVFSVYFDKFLAGRVQYGSWFKHVKEWQVHSSDLNVLVIHYEDLIQSLDKCLKRIGLFAGLSNPDHRYDILAKQCSFDFMKQYEAKFAPEYSPETHPGGVKKRPDEKYPFLRVGKVGTWRDMFTREQELAYDKVFKQMFADIDFHRCI